MITVTRYLVFSILTDICYRFNVNSFSDFQDHMVTIQEDEGEDESFL